VPGGQGRTTTRTTYRFTLTEAAHHDERMTWVNTLTKQASAQTVRNAHARLHKALVVAVRQRYIAHNVADDIELPSARPPAIRPLSRAQTRKLLAQATCVRQATLYRLAVNMGMRQGELLGLTWDAIDWEAGTLRVDRQLKRVPGEEGKRSFVLQPPRPGRVSGRAGLVIGTLARAARLERATNGLEDRCSIH